MSDSVMQSAAIDPQPAARAVQAPAKRVRTAADRKRKDNYTRPIRWAGITARSQEGLYLAEVRADLIKQLGGAPVSAQRLLIEQAAMLSLYLAKLNAKWLRLGELPEHDKKQYIAWDNGHKRKLVALGLKAAPKPTTSPLEYAGHKRAAAAAQRVAE